MNISKKNIFLFAGVLS